MNNPDPLKDLPFVPAPDGPQKFVPGLAGDRIAYTCPRCGKNEIEETTVACLYVDPPYDDSNKATCCACGHRGTVGDWQRIEVLRRRA